jgi:glycosyltransferase involved in cell wall biosynthesis
VTPQPLVSVIIPTYNHAHFLREALQSVCAQTFTNWEAIVVNNYSDDDTVLVVESFADPRIRLENFHNNGVIAASRNRGIALSSGRYVAFLDSDDTWHPDKLMHCIPYLEKGADLVCHALRCIGECDDVIYSGPQQRATFDALLDNCTCITPSATLVRKSILDSVGCFSEHQEFNTSEDYHLWIKLAKAQAKMDFIENIFGEYRVHQSSHSRSALNHMNSIFYVVDAFLPINSSSSLKSRLRVARCKALAYYGTGRNLYKNKQHNLAWSLFFNALMRRPFYVKTYVAIGLNGLAWIVSKFSGERARK